MPDKREIVDSTSYVNIFLIHKLNTRQSRAKSSKKTAMEHQKITNSSHFIQTQMFIGQIKYIYKK